MTTSERLLAGALSFYVWAQVGTAFAAPAPSCEYIPRAEVGELFKSLPVDTVGIANCGDLFPDASIFLITELSVVNRPVVTEYTVALARLLDHGSRKGEVMWRSKNRSQMLIRTSSPRQLSTLTHYAFTATAPDGNQYVFTHSLETRETQKIRPTLDRLHEQLTRADFLKKLVPTRTVARQSR